MATAPLMPNEAPPAYSAPPPGFKYDQPPGKVLKHFLWLLENSVHPAVTAEHYKLIVEWLNILLIDSER